MTQTRMRRVIWSLTTDMKPCPCELIRCKVAFRVEITQSYRRDLIAYLWRHQKLCIYPYQQFLLNKYYTSQPSRLPSTIWHIDLALRHMRIHFHRWSFCVNFQSFSFIDLPFACASQEFSNCERILGRMRTTSFLRNRFRARLSKTLPKIYVGLLRQAHSSQWNGVLKCKYIVMQYMKCKYTQHYFKGYATYADNRIG